MKKITSFLMISAFLFNSVAFADEAAVEAKSQVKTYSCYELYLTAALNKERSRHIYNDRFNDAPHDHLSLNAMATLMGGMVSQALIGSTPVTVGFFLAPAAISIVKNLPSRQEKVLALTKVGNEKFNKFVKKLQKKISPEITAEEVSKIIEDGFNSGKYCENLPKFATRAQIKKMIKKELKKVHSKA